MDEFEMESECAAYGARIEMKSMASSYDLGKSLGRGTFGDVFKAESRGGADRQLVALKVLRNTRTYRDFEGLREVIFYRNVTPHRNLVQLHELFQDADSHDLVLSLECMRGNLYHFIEHYRRRAYNTGIEGYVIAKIVRDVLKGVDHIHKCGFIHRDIKPENILWSGANRHITIKLADFGLSRLAQSAFDHPWTSYVATRWYRTPEQLLSLDHHTPAVDIWAVSLILYELCNLAPLFPGETTADMIHRLVEALGMPSSEAVGGPSLRAQEELSKFYGRSIAGEAHKLRGFTVTADWLRWEEHEVFAEPLIAALQWDPEQRPSASTMLDMLRAAIYRSHPARHGQASVSRPRSL